MRAQSRCHCCQSLHEREHANIRDAITLASATFCMAFIWSAWELKYCCFCREVRPTLECAPMRAMMLAARFAVRKLSLAIPNSAAGETPACVQPLLISDYKAARNNDQDSERGTWCNYKVWTLCCTRCQLKPSWHQVGATDALHAVMSCMTGSLRNPKFRPWHCRILEVSCDARTLQNRDASGEE